MERRVQAVRITAWSTVFVLTLTGLSVGIAAGQGGGSAESGTASRLFDHFIVSGGGITWFALIPLSVATVALTIEHCVSIRRSTLLPEATAQALSEHLTARRYVDAVQLAAQDRSMLGYVVHTAMAEASNGFAAMERAIEEAVEERSARLFRKIEYLNVIGSISPLIGLFGTVYGMIRLFVSIREAGGIPEPSRIASDLSIALVTTFWGLLVAIPALAIFFLFRIRIDVFSAECALRCERLLSVLKPGVAVTVPRPPVESPVGTAVASPQAG
jgi:biopolymer transport protein ExbB